SVPLCRGFLPGSPGALPVWHEWLPSRRRCGDPSSSSFLLIVRSLPGPEPVVLIPGADLWWIWPLPSSEVAVFPPLFSPSVSITGRHTLPSHLGRRCFARGFLWLPSPGIRERDKRRGAGCGTPSVRSPIFRPGCGRHPPDSLLFSGYIHRSVSSPVSGFSPASLRLPHTLPFAFPPTRLLHPCGANLLLWWLTLYPYVPISLARFPPLGSAVSAPFVSTAAFVPTRIRSIPRQQRDPPTRCSISCCSKYLLYIRDLWLSTGTRSNKLRGEVDNPFFQGRIGYGHLRLRRRRGNFPLIG